MITLERELAHEALREMDDETHAKRLEEADQASAAELEGLYEEEIN